MDKSDLILEKLEKLETRMEKLENHIRHIFFEGDFSESTILSGAPNWLRRYKTITQEEIAKMFNMDLAESTRLMDELIYLNLILESKTKVKKVNMELVLSLIRDNEGEYDPLFGQALETVQTYGVASASVLQRKLKVGYARASRILDELEQARHIGPADGSKPRKIL